MATESATQSGKRSLLHRLRKKISHREQPIPSESSVSTELPRSSGSRQRPSVLSGTQPSSWRRNSTTDPAAQAPSHTGRGTSTAEGPAAASTLCEEILEKALELLEERERILIKGYILSNNVASALGRAFEAAQAKRKVCESKRWVFRVGRRTLKLQDEADKVILWLDRFKQVGDIAVNVDPIHAGLPWAGIRLLLEAAVSDTNQMKALLTGLETALYTINRLKAYLEYLPTLPATQSRANFESVLIELHAHILQFLARAIGIYQRRTLSRAIDAFWKPDEIARFETESDRIGARAEIEASNCDRTLSAVEREEANKRGKRLQKAVKELGELYGIGGTINTLSNKIDLARLPSANGASFDSYKDELDARCHPETRVELLRQIKDWAEDRQGKCIFWLNGMAGTGKSTISRTVAQTFADTGQLGASFFFKRGEGERGNASRFFTTVATQLVRTVPAIIPYLSKAIDADPNISDKLMKEQFDSLIFQPLSEIGRHSPSMIELVIVVDALDECERDGDIKNILHLLSRIQHLNSIHVRIFLTSRPELPIRLGFKKISTGVHEDVILQDIAKDTIKDDISSFLKAEFGKIRDDHKNLRPDEEFLPEDWPGEQNIQALSEMAVPLFIFAATVARFVGDVRWNPKKRLADILKYQLNSQASKLDKTYVPILDHLMADLSEPEKEDLTREFRAVVGSIIILAEPLGTSPLARLLNVEKATIDCKLDSLHSVLSIPSSPDGPIRLLHLSFREFLLDPSKRGKNPFWVDEIERHEALATRCLLLLSKCLHEDICQLEFPGKPREEIEQVVIENCLPVDLRYACRYWVHHAVESKRTFKQEDEVYSFLEKHFLHWLEALSLIGKISDSIGMIESLQSVAAINNHTRLSLFLSDARRFILLNRSIIHKAPLQLYSSAIVFTPKESIIRSTFEKPIPWIPGLPKVPHAWNLELQKLEGHSAEVNAVAFSADGQLLASASDDETISLWDPATGEQLQKLLGHRNSVKAVAFSADVQLLASASADHTVRIWNPATGEQLQQLKGHTAEVNTVAFPTDSQLLASASADHTVRIWDLATGEQLQQLEGHTAEVNAVAFSTNSQLLASASADHTVRIWDLATGEQLQLKGHSHCVNAVAFSVDDQLLASASNDKTVRLWNPATGEQLQQLEGHRNWVKAVAFSADNQLLASASWDKTVRLWNTASGEQLQQLEGHSNGVNAVVFSAAGQLLASASYDRTVRLWNPAKGEQSKQVKGHDDLVETVVFSADGQLLASSSRDMTVRLWNPATGEQVHQLEGHCDRVTAIAFSADGQLLASASHDRTVRLWNPATGEQVQQLQGHSDGVTAVAFSAEGELLASASSDRTIKLWSPALGEQIYQLEGHSDGITAVAFSDDGQLLASASYDWTVGLWNRAKGEKLQLLKGHSDWIRAVAFSANGQLLASASQDRSVRIWDSATGEQLHKLEEASRASRVTAIAFSADTQLLASAYTDCTVGIWNLETEQFIQQLQTFESTIKQFRFSSDDQCLETDKGTMALHSGQLMRDSVMPQTSSNLFVNGDWIKCNRIDLLWLPADYRGTCFAWRGNVLAIGQDSGQVHFFEFNI